jgi:hypothetical protein
MHCRTCSDVGADSMQGCTCSLRAQLTLSPNPRRQPAVRFEPAPPCCPCVLCCTAFAGVGTARQPTLALLLTQACFEPPDTLSSGIAF